MHAHNYKRHKTRLGLRSFKNIMKKFIQKYSIPYETKAFAGCKYKQNINLLKITPIIAHVYELFDNTKQ